MLKDYIRCFHVLIFHLKVLLLFSLDSGASLASNPEGDHGLRVTGPLESLHLVTGGFLPVDEHLFQALLAGQLLSALL